MRLWPISGYWYPSGTRQPAQGRTASDGRCWHILVVVASGGVGVLNASLQALNVCNEAFKAWSPCCGDAVNDPFQTLNDLNGPFRTSARRSN